MDKFVIHSAGETLLIFFLDIPHFYFYHTKFYLQKNVHPNPITYFCTNRLLPTYPKYAILASVTTQQTKKNEVYTYV